MQSINQDIKTGNFSQVYLLYGSESYLKNQYKKKLSEALLEAGDQMNFHSYQGKDISFAQIIDQAETMPFFAERRVFLIEESGIFSAEGELLVTYLKTAAPTAYFIFVEGQVDKRSKFYKAATSIGRAIPFERLEERTLCQWVGTLATKNGRAISNETIQYILEKIDNDMENIFSEMEKLISFTYGKDRIMKEDVDAICIEQVQNKIFDMLDAVAAKNIGKVMYYYNQMLELREPPLRILYMIAKQFNQLLQVKELIGKGYSTTSIGNKMALRDFIAHKYVIQATKFPGIELSNALLDCVETEENIKQGRIADKIGVELLIVRYSSK